MEDHENLEQWKREASEKFYRLKALRSRNNELTKTFGYPSACPKHAEIVLCVPSKQVGVLSLSLSLSLLCDSFHITLIVFNLCKPNIFFYVFLSLILFFFSSFLFLFFFFLLQELSRETSRKQVAALHKTMYFPEICMMEGPNQIIARNCTKCFGRGHTRDRWLTQLDSFIEEKRLELSKQDQIIASSQRGIHSIMKSVLEQGRDVDNTRSESRRLERILRSLMSEVRELSRNGTRSGNGGGSGGGGGGGSGGSGAESLTTRLQEKIEQVQATLDNCSHRAMLSKQHLVELRAQLHSGRMELLQHHTRYNNTDTELMLYRRVKIRRQKRLAWNMIAQKEAYTRKVIVTAHELWSRVSEADFRHLLADYDVQKKLEQDHYVSSAVIGGEIGRSLDGRQRIDERQLYELTFKLSTRKLEALMKESIKKMQRFQVMSRQFEGHDVLGDCVRGWMERDTQGRPRLRVMNSVGGGGQEYCHLYQQSGKECSLPCPYNHLHEKMPERLRQAALRRQGFKGNDFSPVQAGSDTITLTKPLLYVSYHEYDPTEVQYLRKLRVYVDGNGSGDGVQQVYGVIYATKPRVLTPTNIFPGGVSAPVDVERGRHPGWIDLPFATPVVLKPEGSESDTPKEMRGVWLGIFAPQGGSIVRVYGKRCGLVNRNLSAGEHFHAAEAPGEFPVSTVVPFRASLYTETCGLWSRLLAVVLDSCRLRVRTNHLALSMLEESNRRRKEDEKRKRAMTGGGFMDTIGGGGSGGGEDGGGGEEEERGDQSGVDL